MIMAEVRHEAPTLFVFEKHAAQRCERVHSASPPLRDVIDSSTKNTESSKK